MCAKATGRYWWSQVTGPASVITQCVHTMVGTGSALCLLPMKVPFEEDFEAQMRSELTSLADTRELVVEQVPTPGADVASCILDRADSVTRNRFRPARETIAAYASRKQVLAGRLLWVVADRRDELDAWLDFAETWHPATPQEGLLLIVHHGRRLRALARREGAVSYDRYVGPRSVALFCAILMDDDAHAGLTERARTYAASLIAHLAGERVDIALKLQESITDTLVDPARALASLGQPASKASSDNVLERIWQAQVECLFPLLEQERLAFVEAHEAELKRILARGGMRDHLGKPIDSHLSLELGDLLWLATQAPKSMKLRGLTQEELTRLRLLRECRNLIAHHKPCSPSKASRLLGMGDENGA